MKKNYDFSKARKGILYRPAKQLSIPIYLDEDVQKKLLAGKTRGTTLGKTVNKILRSKLASTK
jgi:hypothetical protein